MFPLDDTVSMTGILTHLNNPSFWIVTSKSL
jgi:hypothetical protein